MKPLTVLLCLACMGTAAAQQSDKVNPDAQVLQDFNRRVADYLKLHKTAQAQVHRLKPTNSSEEIERYEHHLAREIREARRNTAQGAIFAPPVAEQFRRLIAITMQSAEALHIRQSLQRAAPVQPRALSVNSAYPAGLPLQSTPPSLLQNLPPLPPDLEYRVVGHDLVLRDVDANLIVDFIPNVIS